MNVVQFISDSDDQIDGVEGHYFTFEDVLSIFGGTYLTVNYGWPGEKEHEPRRHVK